MLPLLLPTFLSYNPPKAVLDSTAKVLGRERAVSLWENVKKDDEGFAFLNNFSVLSNLASRHPDSVEALVAPYLRYLLGKALPGDRDRYIRAVVLASGGDGELESYLREGCRFGDPSLPQQWREVVDRALDSLLSYAVRRSRALGKGLYYGPSLEGTTYAFRGIMRSRYVAWGSPPALIAKAKETFPFAVSHLLSIGNLAFDVPSLALAYGRLKGSGEGARFIVKHAYAGRFAALTEYAPAPYEGCLPESLYWAAAQHPKVVGVMLAHSYVGGKPASLNDSLVGLVREETGKLTFPDWLNMGAIEAYYVMEGRGSFEEWLDSLTLAYPATPPYNLGRDMPSLDEAKDLWNAPALLSLYFMGRVVEQLGWEGPRELVPLYLYEEDPAFWVFVAKVEEQVGWLNIYSYAYGRVVERLLSLAEDAALEDRGQEGN